MAFKLAAITLAILFVHLVIFISSTSSSASDDQLNPNFYDKTCPDLFNIVYGVVKKAIDTENRMGASLLRLHFHDCFVNGCDGSILLDDTTNFTGEKQAGPNINSVRGFEVVDEIKREVENNCSNTVSCADILAIAARDSVAILGGCPYNVSLGRRDSKLANFTAANSGSIPTPTSSLDNLTQLFNRHGLSETDLVALSGGHTIGSARCTTFKTRLDKDTNINPYFANIARQNCTSVNGSKGNITEALDFQSPADVFDTNYYKNLVNKNGLLHSDQELYNGGSTDFLVKTFAKNQTAFMSAFGVAMIKMGNIDVLTGDHGEIRLNCRVRNP